eukprot:SM000149S01360  [mRNA]  locus=s149:280764:287589:- [translate_table: standard]
MYNRGYAAAAAVAGSGAEREYAAADMSYDGGLQYQQQPPPRLPGDSRFTPRPFAYNGRVAAALVPCVLVVLGAGGRAVLGTATVGLMAAYILDALQMRLAAFFGIWATLFACAAAAALSGLGFAPGLPLALSGLVLFTCLHLIFLCGIWASLQFRWLQLEQPAVVLALERLLFACCPLVAAAIQTWGVIAAAGVAAAPFYLMPILFGLYWLFSLPRPSSFRAKAERGHGGSSAVSGSDDLILGPLESCLHSAALLFLPLAFFLAIYHSRPVGLEEVCDLLLLFFVPVLFQLFATTRGALWWLHLSSGNMHKVRVWNGLVSLLIVLGCVEARVIFHSFGHYISLPAPFNVLLLTLAVYGVGLACAAHAMGLTKGAVNSTLVTVVLLVAAVSGALVLGMPLKILPAPAIAAVYLAQHATSGTTMSYFVFAAAAALSAAWFVAHSFWNLSDSISQLTVKEICEQLIVGVTLALLMPGAALLAPGLSKPLVGIFLVAQAFLLCRLENRLFTWPVQMDEEGLYPGYLVVLTTVAGFVAVRRLEAVGKANPWAAWLASSLYLAKLPMLLIQTTMTVWASALLILAITPPMLLYRDTAKGAGGNFGGGGGAGGGGASRMKVWQGYAHAGVVFVAVWTCRAAICDALAWLTGERPTDGAGVGALLLVTGAGCMPIVSLHFPHILAARRALVLLVATGLLFVLLQPPVPSPLASVFLQGPSEFTSMHDPEESAIYGEPSRGSTWASWFLLASLVASLAAAMSAIPVQQVAAVRLGYSIAVGASLGVYLCLQYFADFPLLHALLVAAAIAASIFVVFAHHPSASSPRLLPWIFALFVALLPVMYLIEGQINRPPTEDESSVDFQAEYDRELVIEGGREQLLGLYAASFMLIALEVKVKLTGLVRDKTKDRLVGGGSNRHLSPSSSFMPHHRSVQRRTSVASTFSIKKLAADGAWMPAVGNVATLLCFATCLSLTGSLTSHADRAIFFIVPILLLLNQDRTILSGFTDKQRYFPLSLATSAYLAYLAGLRVWQELSLGFHAGDWAAATQLPGASWALKNAAMLLLTLPNHVLFSMFLWDQVKRPDLLLILVSPLNLPALALADVDAIKILAALGLVFAVTQYLVTRHVRLAGLKFI